MAPKAQGKKTVSLLNWGGGVVARKDSIPGESQARDNLMLTNARNLDISLYNW